MRGLAMVKVLNFCFGFFLVSGLAAAGESNVRVALGGGRASVQSSIFLNDAEKQKEVELDLLMDDKLAPVVTAPDLQSFNLQIDADESTSARGIFKELKSAILKQVAVGDDAGSVDHWNFQMPNMHQWKFEYESMQDGNWESVLKSLFYSLRSWMSETYNWIIINIFKILLSLLLGTFLHKISPELQRRSLFYLRRNPFVSFALGWIFLFLLSAAGVGLLLSFVGIPFFFVLSLIVSLLLFMGYILTAQTFLFFVTRVFGFLWLQSTVLRLTLSLVLLTTLEYYVPYFQYAVFFFAMGGFGAQLKELIAPSLNPSVKRF